MTINIEPTNEKCAGLILDKEGRLLIVEPTGKELWINVGGKIEDGETHLECLAREIEEELCLELKGEVTPYHVSAVVPAANNPEKTVRISILT
ncbi:MAG: NUDIX domain-containing protein [Candidatus Dojkabacteria bacterium]